MTIVDYLNWKVWNAIQHRVFYRSSQSYMVSTVQFVSSMWFQTIIQDWSLSKEIFGDPLFNAIVFWAKFRYLLWLEFSTSHERVGLRGVAFKKSIWPSYHYHCLPLDNIFFYSQNKQMHGVALSFSPPLNYCSPPVLYSHYTSFLDDYFCMFFSFFLYLGGWLWNMLWFKNVDHCKPFFSMRCSYSKKNALFLIIPVIMNNQLIMNKLMQEPFGILTQNVVLILFRALALASKS